MMDNKQNLIILPGWGGSHETWADFVNSAKENFEVVQVIDLPCFGSEPCPEKVWGIAEYTEFVKAKIQSLNLSDKIVLLGHSFGGQVAVNFVYKYPDAVNALILSGAAVLRPKFLTRRLIFWILAKTGKLFFKIPLIEKFDARARKFLYRAVRSQEYNESAEIKRAIFKRIIRQDLKSILSKISVPVLLLWGEKDKFTRLKYGRKIFKLIPNAKMRVFKNGGHGLHIHNREEMIAKIQKFLKEI